MSTCGPTTCWSIRTPPTQSCASWARRVDDEVRGVRTAPLRRGAGRDPGLAALHVGAGRRHGRRDERQVGPWHPHDRSTAPRHPPQGAERPTRPSRPDDARAPPSPPGPKRWSPTSSSAAPSTPSPTSPSRTASAWSPIWSGCRKKAASTSSSGRPRRSTRSDPTTNCCAARRPGFRELFGYCTGFATPERLVPERWGSQIYAAGERGDIEPEACPGLMLAYTWAGMDTTVNALSAAVWLFARHPDQWQLVRGDRSLIPSAFNEVLRIEPPGPAVHPAGVELGRARRASHCRRERGSRCCSGRPTATSGTTTPRIASTSPATPSITSVSGAASTIASEPVWRGSKGTP